MKALITLCSFLVQMALPLSAWANDDESNPFQSAAQSGGGLAKDDFDRLDGTGPSGVKVDVIDWAGNLEIHVYPKQSLAGLAMKVDRRQKEKPVMVIGYRFSSNPNHQYIRRALLTMPMSDSFNVFQDKKADGYDKFIVSNHVLSGVAAFKLDKDPEHLYPEGHPLRKDKDEKGKRAVAGSEKSKNENNKRSVPRVTYEIQKRVEKNLEDGSAEAPKSYPGSAEGEGKKPEDNEGGIKHFSW